MTKNFLGSLPTYTPQSWFGEIDELRWKTVWHFSSPYIANTYRTFHCLIIIALRMVSNLETSGLLSVEHPCVDGSHQIYAAAIEMCRCVDYHLMESHKGAGSLFILVPSRAAWKTLGETTPEGQWLMGVVEDISSGDRGRWGCRCRCINEA